MHLSQTVRKSHRLFASHHRGHGKRRYSSGSGRPDGGPAQDSAAAAAQAPPPRLVWPAGARPTPYQILHVEAGRPYDKTNFNRLVKMYHPDMRHRDAGGMAPQARLRRYYLVVAAHELLSNPEQRRRYDLYRLGWMMGHTAPPIRDDEPPAAEAAADTKSEAGGGRRPSPMRQSPIYMSNHAFAILVLVLAFGYAVVSCERVRGAARREKQRAHLVDEEIVRSLYGAQHLVRGRSKDERILAFLCRRHAAAGGGGQHGDEGSFVHFDKDWERNICRH
ncbi:hypothetical protein V2A60_002007 [Cordyceps javanica]